MDSKKVIFTSFDNLFTVNEDGSNLIKATNYQIRGNIYNPTWSVDGTKLLYVRRNDSTYKYELNIVNFDDSGAYKLNVDLSYINTFKWSVKNYKGNHKHKRKSKISW